MCIKLFIGEETDWTKHTEGGQIVDIFLTQSDMEVWTTILKPCLTGIVVDMRKFKK